MAVLSSLGLGRAYDLRGEAESAALQAVETDYGGVLPYLEKALGVGPKERGRWAALYLQAPNDIWAVPRSNSSNRVSAPI